MFTVTSVDCDGTKLSPTAEGQGYQVSLASQAELDAFLATTKSGFAPAPEDGGSRPRNRVVKFLVAGPGGTKEIERGSGEHAAAEARHTEATKRKPKEKPVDDRSDAVKKLDARIARSKKPETIEALKAEREALVAAGG